MDKIFRFELSPLTQFCLGLSSACLFKLFELRKAAVMDLQSVYFKLGEQLSLSSYPKLSCLPGLFTSHFHFFCTECTVLFCVLCLNYPSHCTQLSGSLPRNGQLDVRIFFSRWSDFLVVKSGLIVFLKG